MELDVTTIITNIQEYADLVVGVLLALTAVVKTMSKVGEALIRIAVKAKANEVVSVLTDGETKLVRVALWLEKWAGVIPSLSINMSGHKIFLKK